MNVIHGISLFQMFLLTIAQDASSDSKAEIKLFYDAVCLAPDKYDDVRKCDEIMDSEVSSKILAINKHFFHLIKFINFNR